MNVSIFGKTIENVRARCNIKPIYNKKFYDKVM